MDTFRAFGFWLRFGLTVVIAWATERAAEAQATAVVQKQHKSVQINAATLADDTAGGVYRFMVSLDASATGAKTVTFPSGAVQALPALPPSIGTGFGFEQYFSTETDLSNAYPAGTYTLAFNGASVPVALPADEFPAYPVVSVSGGTWNNGTLTVNRAQALTLTLNYGPSYSSGHARLALSLTGPDYSNSINTGSDLTQQQLVLTIPAGALSNGTAYHVVADLDYVVFTNVSAVPGFIIAPVFESETSFQIQPGALSAGSAPVFTINPQSVTLLAGASLTLDARATGSPTPSYQWYFNGAALQSSATGTRFGYNSVTAAEAGSYQCVATNSAGSASSSIAVVTVPASAPSPHGHLINLSVLTAVQGALSLGFFSGGNSGTGPQTILARGIGPALSAFGLSGLMPDPAISFQAQGASAPLATNSGWGTPAGNIAAIQAADAATGAFALTNPASADAALIQTVQPGGYSLTLAGKSGDSGTALTEIYDDTPSNTGAAHLINLSCTTMVAPGGSLTAGFVIGGSTAKSVLVRGIGPALAGFGLTGVMADPMITVHPSDPTVTVAFNAGWNNDTVIAFAEANVGAFALPANSLDAAQLVTLPPGNYSAVVSSVSGGGGQALVEVYEVP